MLCEASAVAQSAPFRGRWSGGRVRMLSTELGLVFHCRIQHAIGRPRAEFPAHGVAGDHVLNRVKRGPGIVDSTAQGPRFRTAGQSSATVAPWLHQEQSTSFVAASLLRNRLRSGTRSD